MFGAALGEPYVVLGHGMAVSLLECCCGAVDQVGRFRASCRCSACRWVSSVTKTEQVRQALPLSQDCSGGSRHQPLGRNRSARSNRCRLSWSSRENWTRVPSARSLAVARNACSACSSRCGDVVHGHGRGGVPGVALQDVDRAGRVRRAGSAWCVGTGGCGSAARRRPLAVGDLDDVAELAQHPVVGARRVGLVAAAVAQCAARTGSRGCTSGSWSRIQRCCSSMTAVTSRSTRMVSGAMSILLWA